MARLIDVIFDGGIGTTSFANYGTAASTFDCVNFSGHAPEAGVLFAGTPADGNAIAGAPVDPANSALVGTGLGSTEPTDWTMSIWCNFNSVPDQANGTLLIGKLQTPGGGFYTPCISLQTGAGSVGLLFIAECLDTSGTDAIAEDIAEHTYNVWHMVTGTFDSGSRTVSLYVDGVLIGTAATNVSTIQYRGNADWCICGSSQDLFSNGHFEVPGALLAHAFVEDYAWSPAQVFAEYQRVQALLYPPTPIPPPPPLPAVNVNQLPNISPGGVDLGTDILDLSPTFTTVSGLANLGQALLNRLQTPRGGLFYDQNYGTDVRAYLNDALTAQRVSKLASDVQSECLKDERVQTCTAGVQFVSATKTLNITITGSTSGGPFVFVLAVTNLSVSLLEPS